MQTEEDRGLGCRQGAGAGSVPGSRQRLVVLLVLAALLVALSLPRLAVRQEASLADAPVVRESAIFDSYVRLTLWGDREVAEKAVAACLDDLAVLHRTINRFDPESELSALNRSAGDAPFACSELLWEILGAAREAQRSTEGVFDITIGPLMQLWGLHRKRDTLPTAAEIEAALQQVGLQRVHFDDRDRTVRFTVAGMGLDLGGIAKGYALDRVSNILAKHGIERALVDLGGNIGCTQMAPPGRNTFIIGVRNPFDTQAMLGRMAIAGRAVATSGNYERRIVIQGQTVGHIVDPRTGRPVSALAGVTAVARRGVDSDVFSTAVYVAGEALARRLAEDCPGTGFVLVSGTAADPRLTTVGDVQLLGGD